MSNTIRGDGPFVPHHVYVHAVSDEPYFRDDLDRARLLDFVGDVLAKTDVVCLAYSLLDNHLHLILISGARWDISRFMKRVLGRYARYFNRRHRRIGHLRRAPFSSVPIDSDVQLVTEIRYVLLNRLRAGIVTTLDALESDAWTSLAIAMKGRTSLVVDAARVLSIFGSTPEEARANLRSFCLAGVERRDWFEEMTKILESTNRYLLSITAIRTLRPNTDTLATEWERLERIVCERIGVTIEQFRTRRRHARVRTARSVAAFLAPRLLAARLIDFASLLDSDSSLAARMISRGSQLAEREQLSPEQVAQMLSELANAASEHTTNPT